MAIPRLVQALTRPTIAFWASRTEKYEGFSKTKTALRSMRQSRRRGEGDGTHQRSILTGEKNFCPRRSHVPFMGVTFLLTRLDQYKYIAGEDAHTSCSERREL
jgi:hypothetical protein